MDACGFDLIHAFCSPQHQKQNKNKKDHAPQWLVTGVVVPGGQSGYSGLSYTLIQGINSA